MHWLIHQDSSVIADDAIKHIAWTKSSEFENNPTKILQYGFQ